MIPQQCNPNNKIISEQLTQEYILALSRDSPVIRHVVCLWERKEITWEQATYLIIIQLVKINSELQRSVKTLIETSPVVLTFPANSDCHSLRNSDLYAKSDITLNEKR